MTRGLLLAADAVAGTQFEYAYHRLREDAVLVDVASPEGGTLTTDHGSSWDAVAVADLDPSRRYDLVVIPGGGALDSLVRDATTREWLAAFQAAGGVVCAVAEGVRLLSAVGGLDGRLTAAPPAIRDELASAGATVTDEAVTVDGTIVTARDTDALPFGIAAALGSVAIPQDPASTAIERPHWGGPDAA